MSLGLNQSLLVGQERLPWSLEITEMEHNIGPFGSCAYHVMAESVVDRLIHGELSSNPVDNIMEE